ncbi:MAG: hypothetical protein ACYSWP_13225 [Planctomycetota bacterium]
MHRTGKERRYRQMLKADPTLRREPRSKQFFNILDRASPYISSEPMVAAATVRNMIETPALHERGVPAITPKMMKEVIDLEAARQQTRFPALGGPKGPKVQPMMIGE